MEFPALNPGKVILVFPLLNKVCRCHPGATCNACIGFTLARLAQTQRACASQRRQLRDQKRKPLNHVDADEELRDADPIPPSSAEVSPPTCRPALRQIQAAANTEDRRVTALRQPATYEQCGCHPRALCFTCPLAARWAAGRRRTLYAGLYPRRRANAFAANKAVTPASRDIAIKGHSDPVARPIRRPRTEVAVGVGYCPFRCKSWRVHFDLLFF